MVAPRGSTGPGPRLPPGHRRRHRLIELLNSYDEASFITVGGPAGVGKTALTVDWIRDRAATEAVVWVTLDESTATAIELCREIGRALPVPAEKPVAGYAQLARLVNAQGGATTFVVDDCHLADEQALDGLLRFAQLLQHGRVVVLTRRALPLRTVLDAQQVAMAVIGPEDLAFSVEEVSGLIEALDPLVGDRPPADPVVLREMTGGHPLLIRAALTSPGALTPDRVGRVVADWVRALVRPELLEFAALVSGLPVIDDELAIAVAGDAEAGARLAEMACDGLGTVDAGGDFRYHQVVGAALRRHAESVVPPAERERVLQLGAAHLRKDPRHATVAFQLLAETGQIDELWPHFAAHLADALPDDPEQVLGVIPVDLLTAHGMTATIAAVLRSAREPRPSAGLLKTVSTALAEIHAEPLPREPETALFRELAILALLWSAGRFEEAAASTTRLLALTRHLDERVGGDVWSASCWGLLQSSVVLTLTADLDEAEFVLSELEGDREPQRMELRAVQGAFIHAMRGEVSVAARTLTDLDDEIPESVEWAARLAITRAAIQLEDGDPVSARETLKVIEPSLLRVREWPYALIVTARSHLATDPIAGLEDLDRLLKEHGRRPIAPGVRDLLDSAVADLALAAGDVGRAKRLVSRRRDHDIALRLTAARIALADPREEAVEDLRRLVERNGVWPRLRAQALLLLAAHHHRLGEEKDAQDALRRALGITGGQGIRLIHTLIPGQSLEAIATTDGLAAPELVSDANPLEEVLASVSLTKREMRLLQRLATRDLLREIAAAEFVSLSTIKSQTTSLYRKLGVHSRTEAVRTARLKGMLDPLDRVPVRRGRVSKPTRRP